MMHCGIVFMQVVYKGGRRGGEMNCKWKLNDIFLSMCYNLSITVVLTFQIVHILEFLTDSQIDSNFNFLEFR